MSYKLKTTFGEYTLQDTQRNSEFIALLDQQVAPGIVTIDTNRGTLRINLSEPIPFEVHETATEKGSARNVTIYS